MYAQPLLEESIPKKLKALLNDRKGCIYNSLGAWLPTIAARVAMTNTGQNKGRLLDFDFHVGIEILMHFLWKNLLHTNFWV